jgi:hypothetical protein
VARTCVQRESNAQVLFVHEETKLPLCTIPEAADSDGKAFFTVGGVCGVPCIGRAAGGSSGSASYCFDLLFSAVWPIVWLGVLLLVAGCIDCIARDHVKCPEGQRA